MSSQSNRSANSSSLRRVNSAPGRQPATRVRRPIAGQPLTAPAVTTPMTTLTPVPKRTVVGPPPPPPPVTTTVPPTIPMGVDDRLREAKLAMVRSLADQMRESTQASTYAGQIDQLLDVLHSKRQLTDEDLDLALRELVPVEMIAIEPVPPDVIPEPIGLYDIELGGEHLDTLGPTLSPMMYKTTAIQASVLQYMIEDGGFSFTSTEALKVAINGVADLYKTPRDPVGEERTAIGEEYFRLAERMREDKDEPTKLGNTLGVDASSVSLPQARALNRFLAEHPDFVWNLRKNDYLRGIKFGESRAEKWGGGVFDRAHDKKIEMAALPVTPPDAFVRLFVHETGHAGFERRLLGEIPDELNRDQVSGIRARVDYLNGLMAGGAQLTREQNKELRKGEKKLRKLNEYAATMSPDAKVLYRAWRTLRRDNGRHMLGVDLGLSPQPDARDWKQYLNPAQRRSYQAQKFYEFCAEGFMLYAMGDLDSHVEQVQANESIAPAVKQAWQDAQAVFHKHASPFFRQMV
jgi:hypothetical protein